MNGSQSRGYSDLSILGRDRRKNIFRFAHVDAATQLAVAHAVKEINQQPDCEPDKKTSPRFER